MKRSLPIIALFVSIFSTSAQKPSSPHTYYVSPQGSDNNVGASPSAPWQTIAKVNNTILQPGDKVLFQGGKTFTGTIVMDSADSGTPGDPVVITSYGKGQAVIGAGNANGFTGINCSNIKIAMLHFTGSGVDSSTGSGILFNSTRMDKQCNGIAIDHCTAEGFHNYGILINCSDGEAVKGFDNVTISNCVATGNGEAGIASLGGQTGFHHTHIHITKCTAYRNKGIPAKTNNHSGNGIVMSSAQYLLIDSCLAYENGALNHCTGGGPVGIWMWICKDAVIEHCESHHNHAGLTKDGGGFDIDGGCANCTLQYNYSHDNEGAGYLLAEYGAGMPFTNNTVRFNISQNDGRKNSYGGIAFWGVSENFRVNNTYVYNNTVYVNDSAVVNGLPAAVMAMGNNFNHVLVANNVFITAGAARMLNSDAQLDTSALYFAGNNYYSTNNTYAFNYNGNVYKGIAAWLAAANMQETYAGKRVALSVNPGYVSARQFVKTASIANPVASTGAYHLKPGAKPNNSLNLNNAFGINVGLFDYYNNRLSTLNYPTTGATVK